MKAKIIYRLLLFIGSDYLLHLFIDYVWWTGLYYAVNKDGTKTKCAINYFPANPESLNDGGERFDRIKSSTKTKLKAFLPNPTVDEIATLTATLNKRAAHANATSAMLNRIGNNRLVEIMEVDTSVKWTNWKTSYIPLKYLSINA